MKKISISIHFTFLIVALFFAIQLSAQTIPCNTNAPVTYTIAETGPGEIWIPDASTKPWKGGDTLKIPARNYSLIEISNFTGDPCNKIVIINSGGQVITNTWRMRFDSRYFKITGTGNPGIENGFKISGGMLAITLAHDFEIDHVEATGGSVGFYIKTVPDISQPKTIYTIGSSSNYVMSNIYLHHNYIHDVAGEAMYIGHTGPNGNQEGTGLIPLRMSNVEIAYNNVSNTDWDGIQLSNARNSKIHDNKVWNFGRTNTGSQQAGIIMGGNTTGEIYNNTIDSSGNDFTANGQETVLADDYITTPEVNPKQQIFYYNNVIRNPKPKGGVRVAGYNNNSLPASLTDNQYYIPNAASNWQFYYVVANPVGSIKTNNVLIGVTTPPPVNQLPVANAGTDIIITLPLNSVSLNGTGTDPDGTVSAYAWTQISGPVNSVIATPAIAATTISGFVQGVYKFELKVTDNSGALSRDTVLVTVNPAIIINPTSRKINVNINNGTTYSNSQWNNWNTNASFSSILLKYDDASTSAISAVLNSQAMVIDNGSSYAPSATNPPAPVLRYNSASTSTRLLTIKGLNPLMRYNFEFYGSRGNSGKNQTIFSIGAIKDTINTDYNINDVARLNNIFPDATGNAIVSIARIGNWNYIAGFAIIEQSTTARSNELPATTTGIINNTGLTNNEAFIVSPEIFTSSLKVVIKDSIAGNYSIAITDLTDNIIWNKSGSKGIDDLTEMIDTKFLKTGAYLLKIITKKGISVHHVSKKLISIPLN